MVTFLLRALEKSLKLSFFSLQVFTKSGVEIAGCCFMLLSDTPGCCLGCCQTTRVLYRLLSDNPRCSTGCYQTPLGALQAVVRYSGCCTGCCQTTLGAVQAVVRYPWVLYRLFSDNPGCCIGCCQTTLVLFRLSKSPDAIGCQKTRVLLSNNPDSV